MKDFKYLTDGGWVHVRIVEPHCGTCRFFDPAGQGNEGGQCRRYPPVIVPMIVPNAGEFTQAEQMRPWVSSKDSCGEWKGRPIMEEVPAK